MSAMLAVFKQKRAFQNLTSKKKNDPFNLNSMQVEIPF